ncbi:hypothetical protein GCM10018781_36580 [Kitasatospora indigofera]|uniref:Uncharacterized protein n=1 Tax=Kitasatospora indigofera TaxID=67307 RepID=A0A919KVC0_9ACTN|nr:hypothetical protein [Kitasatospora indigofera]GHH73046.1 hypothetical protein GCM10018781_36580 [Kitasatospora indigofera]
MGSSYFVSADRRTDATWPFTAEQLAATPGSTFAGDFDGTLDITVRLGADHCVPVDSPELRAVMAAHLADPHLAVRLEAAAGLALRGDERGLTVLDEIGHGIKHFRSHGAARLDMVRDMLRVRTATDDQGR